MLAGRRLKKRSLLKVNEHFSDKPDAADDALSQEIIVCRDNACTSYPNRKDMARCGLPYLP